MTPEQYKDTDAEAGPVPVSIYVIADLDTEEGRELAQNAVQFVVSS